MSLSWLTSGSISLGTARSTIRIGFCRRNLSARSTVPLPIIGSWDAVEAITISISASFPGMDCKSMGLPPSCSARRRALSSVRLAMVICCKPADTRCRPTSSEVSPAPSSSTRDSARLVNSCPARVTAVEATDTEFSPMAVSVRTFLAMRKQVCAR